MTALTALEVPAAIGKQEIVVKVEITADTIITRSGKGVPLFKGSVLNVTAHDAGMLIASMKAKKVGPDVPEKIVPNPYLNSPQKKAS